MFEPIPLPPDWPVYVSQAEATAYARWQGPRLPTEAEYHRAAFGTPDGDRAVLSMGRGAADGRRTANFDFARFEPAPVGSHPGGASAWGVHDLVGNGWEWTSTVFGPFDGFAPMASYPEYSADFFDGQHYVMKGASPATARELVRRSFRNWFRAELSVHVREVQNSVNAMQSLASPDNATATRRSPIEFAADVRRDLQLTPKQLQSKYFYDALGSSLFEAICRLPWYRITRAEHRLLDRARGGNRGGARRRTGHDRRARMRQRRKACRARRTRCSVPAAPRASTY